MSAENAAVAGVLVETTRALLTCEGVCLEPVGKRPATTKHHFTRKIPVMVGGRPRPAGYKWMFVCDVCRAERVWGAETT